MFWPFHRNSRLLLSSAVSHDWNSEFLFGKNLRTGIENWRLRLTNPNRSSASWKDLISYGMRKLCRIWASFCSTAWRSNITVTSQLWICLFSVSYYRWNSTKVTESTLPPIPSLKIKINSLEFAVTLTERMGMTLCYGITNPRKPLKNLVIVGGVALTLYAKIV